MGFVGGMAGVLKAGEGDWRSMRGAPRPGAVEEETSFAGQNLALQLVAAESGRHCGGDRVVW